MSITYTTPQGAITHVRVATNVVIHIADIVADLMLAGARAIHVN